MAQAPASAHVFRRGDRVLDYWLVRAEGFTLQPSGGRVEEVVVARSSGRAETLVVRSRSGRRRAIPATAVAAVDPSRHELVVAVERSTARAWLGPRAGGVARAVSRRTIAAAAWTAPRLVLGIRVTLLVAGRVTLASARAVGTGASIVLRETQRLVADTYGRRQERSR